VPINPHNELRKLKTKYPFVLETSWDNLIRPERVASLIGRPIGYVPFPLLTKRCYLFETEADLVRGRAILVTDGLRSVNTPSRRYDN